jgi:hypothetical protein
VRVNITAEGANGPLFFAPQTEQKKYKNLVNESLTSGFGFVIVGQVASASSELDG